MTRNISEHIITGVRVWSHDWVHDLPLRQESWTEPWRATIADRRHSSLDTLWSCPRHRWFGAKSGHACMLLALLSPAELISRQNTLLVTSDYQKCKTVTFLTIANTFNFRETNSMSLRAYHILLAHSLFTHFTFWVPFQSLTISGRRNRLGLFQSSKAQLLTASLPATWFIFPLAWKLLVFVYYWNDQARLTSVPTSQFCSNVNLEFSEWRRRRATWGRAAHCIEYAKSRRAQTTVIESKQRHYRQRNQVTLSSFQI